MQKCLTLQVKTMLIKENIRQKEKPPGTSKSTNLLRTEMFKILFPLRRTINSIPQEIIKYEDVQNHVGNDTPQELLNYHMMYM